MTAHPLDRWCASNVADVGCENLVARACARSIRDVLKPIPAGVVMSTRALFTWLVCASSLSVQAQPADADGVRKAFLSAVDACRAAVAAYVPPGPARNTSGKWVALGLRQASVEAADATSSTSIVTPWLGWVKLRVIQAGQLFEDEAAARSAQPAITGRPLASVDLLKLAWSDGRWKLIGGQSEILNDDGTPLTKIAQTVAALRGARSPQAACAAALDPTP